MKDLLTNIDSYNVYSVKVADSYSYTIIATSFEYTYLNFQFNGWYVRMRCLHFWVKGSRSSTRVLSPHHSWLQDVATPTVQPEEPLVEVHTCIWVLIV